MRNDRKLARGTVLTVQCNYISGMATDEYSPEELALLVYTLLMSHVCIVCSLLHCRLCNEATLPTPPQSPRLECPETATSASPPKQ